MTAPNSITTGHTALLLIDMQVDFGAPDGAMARQGKDMTAPQIAMTNAAALTDAARAAGVTLVFVRLLQQEGDLCVEGMRGADFIGPLPQIGDRIVSKSRYSAFTNTGLAEWLRERTIDTVVLAGLTTECCIQATAWAAFELDFWVVLAGDACAAYDEDVHRHALRALELSGAAVAASTDIAVIWRK